MTWFLFLKTSVLSVNEFIQKGPKKKLKFNVKLQDHCCPSVQMLEGKGRIHFTVEMKAAVLRSFPEFSFCLFVFQWSAIDCQSGGTRGLYKQVLQTQPRLDAPPALPPPLPQRRKWFSCSVLWRIGNLNQQLLFAFQVFYLKCRPFKKYLELVLKTTRKIFSSSCYIIRHQSLMWNMGL